MFTSSAARYAEDPVKYAVPLLLNLIIMIIPNLLTSIGFADFTILNFMQIG